MNASVLAKIIIKALIKHRDFLNSIFDNQDGVVVSKFYLLLRLFLAVEWKLSTTFHPETNSSIKRQNSIKEIYLLNFVKVE